MVAESEDSSFTSCPSLRLTLPKPSEADVAMTRTADALLKNLHRRREEAVRGPWA